MLWEGEVAVFGPSVISTTRISSNRDAVPPLFLNSFYAVPTRVGRLVPPLSGPLLEEQRGGGVWHDAFGVMISSAAGGAYWPIPIRCPSLGPFPSVGGGAHRLLTRPVTFLFLLALTVPLPCLGGGGSEAQKKKFAYLKWASNFWPL